VTTPLPAAVSKTVRGDSAAARCAISSAKTSKINADSGRSFPGSSQRTTCQFRTWLISCHLIAGGFHLVAPDDVIASVATSLKDKFKVENVAPGHCTGEPMFAALKKAFGDR
jgi:hypothetical protein